MFFKLNSYSCFTTYADFSLAIGYHFGRNYTRSGGHNTSSQASF